EPLDVRGLRHEGAAAAERLNVQGEAALQELRPRAITRAVRGRLGLARFEGHVRERGARARGSVRVATGGSGGGGTTSARSFEPALSPPAYRTVWTECPLIALWHCSLRGMAPPPQAWARSYGAPRGDLPRTESRLNRACGRRIRPSPSRPALARSAL